MSSFPSVSVSGAVPKCFRAPGGGSRSGLCPPTLFLSLLLEVTYLSVWPNSLLPHSKEDALAYAASWQRALGCATAETHQKGAGEPQEGWRSARNPAQLLRTQPG